MAIIKCKMCGGDIDIAPDKTFGTCEYCGNTMTLPRIDDEQRAAAFNRGNHFRRIGEFDKALAVYERIVREDENDAEAHWCSALCRFGIEYVEDPTTYEWLPTCHRASFDNFLEDVDYLAAVEHSEGITKRQYQRDAAKIAEVQRGILATSQNEEPYDVFICYKETDEDGERTRDSAMAQDIYYQLTEQGRRVFFARITLEDKVGTEYEPYIFAALNSAKVMVVVGTKPEHLNAVWVKNEWSRFLAMMKHDRNKLLLPCYRDMDPYDLPEQLSVLQSYDMSKIGFIQDLTRGISKVLNADKKPEPEQEMVVVQQTGGYAGNTDALLDRGYMSLEDREWEKADGFFEEVLNHDSHCAEAYLGEFLAEQRAVSLASLPELESQRIKELKPVAVTACEEDQDVFSMLNDTYCVPGAIDSKDLKGRLNYDRTFLSLLPVYLEEQKRTLQCWNDNRKMIRTLQFADPELTSKIEVVKQKILSCLPDLIAEAQAQHDQDAENVIAGYHNHLECVRLEYAKNVEEKYQQAIIFEKDANQENQYIELKSIFESLGVYKDSADHAAYCGHNADKIHSIHQIYKDAVEHLTAVENANTELLKKIDLFNEMENYDQSVEIAEKYIQISKELDKVGDNWDAPALASDSKKKAAALWKRFGRCEYCGGKLKGFFTFKCSSCGRIKSY